MKLDELIKEIQELKDFTIDLTDIDELALGLEVCSKKSNMVIQEFADTIIQLQQENKQLKEDLKRYKQIYRENPTLYDEIAPYIIRECELENKINLYKSVIDEISEYEENSSFDIYTRDFGRLTVCDADELALILDKANIKESE